MSPNLFDEETIYCCVKARLDLGEDPGTIFEELRSCPVVDISSLRLVMNKLAPGRFTENPSRRRKTNACPEKESATRSARCSDIPISR